MKQERINEIWGVLYLLFGLFTLMSLAFFDPEDLAFFTSHPNQPVSNVTGIIGAWLGFGLFITFGVSAFLLPVLFLLWSGCYFLQRVPEKKFFKFTGLIVALFSLSTIVAISVVPEMRLAKAGALGYLAGTELLNYFGYAGSFILSSSCLLLAMLLATDFLIYPLVKNSLVKLGEFAGGMAEIIEEWKAALVSRIESLQARRAANKAFKEPLRKKNVKQQESTQELPKSSPIKVKTYNPALQEAADKLKEEAAKEAKQNAEEAQKKVPKQPKLVYKPESQKQSREEVESQVPSSVGEAEEKEFSGVVGSADTATNYELPAVKLLNKPAAAAKQSDDLEANSRILEKTFSEFGIDVKVTEIEQGPVITRYELLPAPGVKVNSISSLSDDIKLALKAKSIRFIIPIPGKSAVGVEVPNSVSNTVSFREMIDTREFQSNDTALPLVLGKSANGRPMIADLSKMPHILIAGSTGSGKTVAVNSIITGLLYRFRPDELKFVMVDPKMVELISFNKIPHMLTPVVTDARKAAHTLNWVVQEMENRYKLFATVGVRNIDAFNSRPVSEEAEDQMEENEDSENVVPRKLPYIVVIIDELADLMLVARDKVEALILRLAQLARASGIHMILATQRPSVNVITGVIKANFPARLSFKVSSKVDSRTVLDAGGAETLIGRGDMLFLQPGDPKPARGQAPFISDGEINAVVDYVADQEKPKFRADIQQAQDGRNAGGKADEKDELFDEAVRVVLETKQASTSNLQRRMRLGYTRAARIIDQLEAEGIIGPAQGSKPREIFMTLEEAEV